MKQYTVEITIGNIKYYPRSFKIKSYKSCRKWVSIILKAIKHTLYGNRFYITRYKKYIRTMTLKQATNYHNKLYHALKKERLTINHSMSRINSKIILLGEI